jgi:hypothetical protein
LANVPNEIVSAEAVNWVSCVRVPPEIISVANDWAAAKLTLPVSENVTDDAVAVNVVHAVVLHEPVDIVIVADPNAIVATPEHVRLLAPNVAVALVNVRVPENVRELPNVVLIAVLTVTLFAISSIEIVPAETLIAIVDVPTV